MNRISRIIKVSSVLAGLGALFVLYQNATFNDLVNTINRTNPGRITIKVGELGPGIYGETQSLPDGGQLITIAPVDEASQTSVLMHEIMHATSQLNDDPLNFQVIGVDSTIPVYEDSFTASEVSAFFVQAATSDESMQNMAYTNPDELVSLTDPLGQNFYTLYAVVDNAVSQMQYYLSISEISNGLATAGAVRATVNGITVKINLQASPTGTLSLICSGCGSKMQAYVFPSKTLDSSPGAMAKAVTYITDKFNRAKQLLSQMNPNTANGRALQAANKAALAKAKEVANFNIQNRTSRPPYSGIPTRVGVPKTEINLTGLKVVDLNGMSGQTATITAGPIVDPAGNILAPAVTVTVPVYNDSAPAITPTDGITVVPGCIVPCPNKN